MFNALASTESEHTLQSNSFEAGVKVGRCWTIYLQLGSIIKPAVWWRFSGSLGLARRCFRVRFDVLKWARGDSMGRIPANMCTFVLMTAVIGIVGSAFKQVGW